MNEVSQWAVKISNLFSAARKSARVKEKDVYNTIVQFLRARFGDNFVVAGNQVLLLRIMAFFKNNESYLGYSASDADIVIFLKEQITPNLEILEKSMHRTGQYSLRKWNGIYPAVIGQVVVSTTTGKLQLENMKAQAWRNLFPRSLIIFLAGPYREEFDIRYDREMSYFDLVLVGFEDKTERKKNLLAMSEIIESHLEAK